MPDALTIYTSDPNEHILFFSGSSFSGAACFQSSAGTLKESNYSNDNVGNMVDLLLISHNLTGLISSVIKQSVRWRIMRVSLRWSPDAILCLGEQVQRAFPRQPPCPLGRPFHRQADYCVADVKEKPLTAYSPTAFHFWTSCGKEEKKRKDLKRWLSDTSSQVARQRLPEPLVVVFVRCGQRGQKQNSGGCVTAASTDKSVVVVQKYQIRPRCIYTQIVYNCRFDKYDILCNVHSRLSQPVPSCVHGALF